MLRWDNLQCSLNIRICWVFPWKFGILVTKLISSPRLCIEKQLDCPAVGGTVRQQHLWKLDPTALTDGRARHIHGQIMVPPVILEWSPSFGSETKDSCSLPCHHKHSSRLHWALPDAMRFVACQRATAVAKKLEPPDCYLVKADNMGILGKMWTNWNLMLPLRVSLLPKWLAGWVSELIGVGIHIRPAANSNERNVIQLFDPTHPSTDLPMSQS